VGVGDVAEADSDRFGHTVDMDEADAGVVTSKP
jgi:hypothetical protein